jgi:hypothetical protein
MAIVMKKTKASKTASTPRPSSPRPPVEQADQLWNRIAHKAYELWDARGRLDGNALQDWLDAEQTVMDEIHEARE